MTVDWTKPIEAVHEGGAVRKAAVAPTGKVVFENRMWQCDDSGVVFSTGWRIRNVQPAAAKPAEIDAALVERMVALLRHAAVSASGHTQEEARAIVAELPEPVDPDLLEARRVASDQSLTSVEEAVAIRRGEIDQCAVVQLALAAIRRGRQLEREAK